MYDNYGWTQEIHAEMLKKQRGRCGICEIPQGKAKQSFRRISNKMLNKPLALLCSKCSFRFHVAVKTVRPLKSLIDSYLEEPAKSSAISDIERMFEAKERHEEEQRRFRI